jgi:hypothetical protein
VSVTPEGLIRRGGLALAVACGLGVLSSPAARPAPLEQPNPASSMSESTFTDREAAPLIGQITDALGAHNPRKMLAVFDTDKMNGGPAFRQQINSFFSQTTNIRAHFNLVQAGSEAGRNFVAVDAEMEADPVDERLQPVHKQAQLRFLVESSGSVWKFIDVQPRTFFSGSQP